jgi:hypothetical protein
MTTRVRVFGLVLVAAIAVGACSSSGDDEGVRGESSVAETDAAAPVAAGGEALTADSANSAGAAPAQVPQLQQKVIKNAELRVKLRADRFRAAFSDAVSIAEANGGFVADSQTSGSEDEGASGSLTIRVPSDRFDAARTSLSELGELESETISGQDVTGQLTDLEARLRNLRAQEEALRTLMGKAVNVGETMQVQQQLFSIREQIEQLAAQQAQLTDAVSLATLRLSLYEPGASFRPDDREPTSLADALERAVDAAVTVVGALVIGLGFVLPLALLALLAWLVWRRTRTATAGSPAAG